MNLKASDLTSLGITKQNYRWAGQVTVMTANKSIERDWLQVDIQLRNQNGAPVSEWIMEDVAVVDDGDDVDRLSGEQIRNHLYFATSPGNQYLYISDTKTGIMQQLPGSGH